MKAETSVTVVTANLNGAATLQRCLDSVAGQRGVIVHHIVVDGGSNDGSVSMLKERQGNGLSFISEPDKGIADAMNKGARLAQGDWLLFLQADDCLCDAESLKTAIEMGASAGCGLIACGINLEGRSMMPNHPGAVNRGWRISSPFKQAFRHQGLLVSRKAWELVGPYDTSFRITMDFDWMLRARWKKVSVARVGLELADVSASGISSADGGSLLRLRLQEEQISRIKNAPGPVWRFVYGMFWILYRPYRIIRTRLNAR